MDAGVVASPSVRTTRILIVANPLTLIVNNLLVYSIIMTPPVDRSFFVPAVTRYKASAHVLVRYRIFKGVAHVWNDEEVMSVFVAIIAEVLPRILEPV